MPTFPWTCPGCGLLCDDLHEQSPYPGVGPSDKSCASTVCARAHAWQQSVTTGKDQQASLNEQRDRLEQLAQRLTSSRSPLIWLGDVDVSTARAAIALADHLHATVALDQSPQTAAIHRLLQRSGHFTGTLGEIRSRADLMVVMGNQWEVLAPRLKEQLTPPTASDTLGDPFEITRWFLLERDPRSVDLLAELRRRFRSKSAASSAPFTNDVEFTYLADQLEALCRTRKYIAWIWHESALGESAERLLHELLPFIELLNEHTRSVSVRLEDRPGLLTAAQVCTWQTGCAPPVKLTSNGPVPLEQLNLDAFDFALVISDLDLPQHVPDALPRSILSPMRGHQPAPGNDQDIVVTTPGMHRAGHVQRGDQAWMMRLVPLLTSNSASAPECLEWLLNRLGASSHVA